MSRPLASLSLDLDNKWSYMKTHGDQGWENYPSYLDVVVPRVLHMLDELGLRITVFVVGQDAAIEKNRSALASIASAGHEIGNHSFHHEPWLHLYSPEQLEAELSAAEDAIEDATGVRPTGFRGPGYSLSPAVIGNLAHRGYQYDASTLPTFLGPLARAYYLLTAKLSPEEFQQRRRLFGRWRDGLRPIKPYWWQIKTDGSAGDDPISRPMLEIPVTTMPVFRLPIHVSYLLFLWQFSSAAAWSYWRLAMGLCWLCKVEPSLLLHPLDFLGADDEPDLAFFPAMQMRSAEKVAFVHEVLADFGRRFQVMPLGEHAAVLGRQCDLPIHCLTSPPTARHPAHVMETI
jgi:peptidoglycan-N-acetylglucosamine deacetylase